MTASDPLEFLHAPTRPVDPDPTFARDLRARLERALLAPEGTTMTTIEATRAGTLPLHAVTPYLAVVDAAAALDFYVEAFGAVRRGEPIVMPDGRIGHAEIAIGDSVLMLADEYPEIGLVAPANRGGATGSLRLEVADPDAVVAAAVAAGAVLDRPVGDSPYGRGGAVLDPSGHRWMVSREAPGGPRAGDLGYASLWTRDVRAAERFYGDLLGWTTVGRGGERGRQVTNLALSVGMFGGQSHATLFTCWAVPDVDATVVLVRAAGGTAGEPADEPYGRIANCVDDQGLPFAVFTPPGGPGAAPDLSRPGEITYLTMEMPDSTRARAFYATVLGWRFQPGREPGVWNVLVDGEQARPPTGISGGHGEAGVVPMFAVADVASAAAAVRAAGGSATEPAFAGYGTSAACTDDQGARFAVVQY